MEEVASAGSEVAHHRVDRLGGVAEACGNLVGWQALEEVGAQRLVAALGRVGGLGEELAAWPPSWLGRSR
jgi:hypothetical protein